jgi:hypothetical protein
VDSFSPRGGEADVGGVGGAQGDNGDAGGVEGGYVYPAPRRR